MERIYLNDGWKFSENFVLAMTDREYDDRTMEEVRIPHTCKELPLHYFDEQMYQMVSGYRKRLFAQDAWKKKRVLLTFEGAAHEAKVYINGKLAGEHHCGYTAFTLDISQYLKYGEENLIAVSLDSREDLNIPPFGYVIDYMTYGGIYRDVYLEVKEPVFIEDVFYHSQIEVKQEKADERMGTAVLTSEIFLHGAKEGKGLRIQQFYRRKTKNTAMEAEEAAFVLLSEKNVSGEETQVMESPLFKVVLWEVENPALYESKLVLRDETGILEEKITTIGFRKAEFKKEGFYLNDRKVKLRGLNRHQSYPYVGYAMPKSMQYLDADLLKEELGVNAVRTSHYPQSQYFIDRCDEIGLLVFTEIPGWQHIGDEAWKAQAVENVREMVVQYRNHPSIILWGVRINESKDEDEFYKKTNAMAKQLDPYRQTGGVRAIKKSSLLEDVYTYNDFSHDGRTPGCESKKAITSDMEKPYLVTEYCGHMYPTKAFDCEEHRLAQALRHANVLDAIAAKEEIAGSFGWCMTDYNTHKDFGSGDRICYHGVLDMFRNPKLAAEVYHSQKETDVVLEVSSTMDIGEHPGGSYGETWIFTNADCVKMYKNDQLLKTYSSASSSYQNLKYGPILVDDYIGDGIEKNESFTKSQAKEIKDALNYVALHGTAGLPKRILFTVLKMLTIYRMKPIQAVELYSKYVGDWGGTSTVFRFDAIKDGRVVKTIVKKPMTKLFLEVRADHTKLVEETSYDVAALRIRAVDENGNLLPFYNEPVTIATEGVIQLIGSPVISCKGGMAGAYVKTTGKAGTGTVYLQTGRTDRTAIEFQVER